MSSRGLEPQQAVEYDSVICLRQASSDALLPSCVIVAVNGRRKSQEQPVQDQSKSDPEPGVFRKNPRFATELAKPVVTIVSSARLERTLAPTELRHSQFHTRFRPLLAELVKRPEVQVHGVRRKSGVWRESTASACCLAGQGAAL